MRDVRGSVRVKQWIEYDESVSVLVFDFFRVHGEDSKIGGVWRGILSLLTERFVVYEI